MPKGSDKAGAQAKAQPPAALAPETPAWVRDAVFYHIFPDRFAQSPRVPKPAHLQPWGAPPTPHGYQGGDLLGIAERLDYLADLGVNAIYLNPIFQSGSNHRYHTHDYSQVDPMLGGNAALRELIDQAHGRGFRVVLDGVFNHASRGFFAFHDILENGPDSAYLDWFTVESFPPNAYDTTRPPGYRAWWGLHALPKFNTDTPAVREFLLGVGRKWVEFGIDGWRLDVAAEIDDDSFWQEFRRRVRLANPEAYLVGEVWGPSVRWLKGDMWDAVTNYIFTRACIAFFVGKEVELAELKRTCLYPAGPAGAQAFRRAIDALLALYHPNVTAVMLNPLSSHDMARFVTLARGDQSALRLATLFQMTYPGAPCIYYGDEIGLAGGHDPANRGAFPWNEAEWDHEIFRYFQKLISLRHSHPALRHGTYEVLLAKGGVHVHQRRLGGEVIVVAINAGKAAQRVDVPVADCIDDGGVLKEAWSRETFRVEKGHLRALSLAPRSGRVLIKSSAQTA